MKQTQKHFTILVNLEKKENHISFNLVLCILDNGRVASVMDSENRHGLMEQNMKVNGKKTELMERGNLSMSTVIFMMDIGLMIKLTAVEFTNIKMELNKKEFGRMIF